MNKFLILSIILIVFILLDWYCYGAFKAAFQHSNLRLQKAIRIGYVLFSAFTVISIVSLMFVSLENINSTLRNFVTSAYFTNFIVKLILALFLAIEDITRLFRWAATKVAAPALVDTPPINIERAEFLAQAALVVATLPIVAVGYGIISGAHDYRVRKVTLALPNLPSAFHGLKILQISDVHSGSFFNKNAVKGGVEKIMNEKADVIFFTGDLVNNESREMNNWVNVFEKIKAPMGVYSTLGNHDYGDYRQWASIDDKKQNVKDLIRIHKNMGWDILMNEHRMLKQGGDQLAILGIENWGAGARWPKYGKLDLAHKNTEQAAVKLLLSHDPSHWDAQVIKGYQDIDVMFAGHTHGFQFGVEVGSIKWSPVQYVYKQWAGMYQENNQRLYVNRGFGYLGFPGRVGMPPEITVFELQKAS